MLFQHLINVEKIVIGTNILKNVGTFLENVGRSLQKMLIKNVGLKNVRTFCKMLTKIIRNVKQEHVVTTL
jgi:hypothetical protein